MCRKVLGNNAPEAANSPYVSTVRSRLFRLQPKGFALPQNANLRMSLEARQIIAKTINGKKFEWEILKVQDLEHSL